MPPNKKKSSSKKKGKQKGKQQAAPAATAPPACSTPTASVGIDIGKGGRGSNDAAASYAELFAADYPPTMDVDKYVTGLSNKAGRKAGQAYSLCSQNFNRGIQLTQQVSANPGPTTSRWHLAEAAYLDAVDAAMKDPDVFLKTRGMDHRNLLCKVLLSVAQCRGRLLDGTGMVAWSRAAIAADPVYYNGHSQLSIGLQNEYRWEEALEAAKRALASEGSEMAPRIPFRIDLLERIVRAEPKSREWTEAVRVVLEDKRGPALRCWQECNVSRPKRSCAMCFWGAESRCARCETVDYCSRTCQSAHYKEHKPNCVAAAAGNTKSDAENSDQRCSRPDYPIDEWMDDTNWEMFQVHAKQIGLNLVQCAANNCHVGALKRTLMEEGGMNYVNKLQKFEYPIHRAALRNEPDAAVDIFRILLKHGACPNVIRCDDKHLLDVCRGRANWIDDADPSMGNLMFRMPYQLGGAEGLEEVERKESAELVELVTEAIQMHAMCKLCKKQKARRVDYARHAGVPNMTDVALEMMEREKTEGINDDTIPSFMK